MIEIKEKHYFAYGSNMNLNQMAFRCPDAEVVGPVRLEGYCLAFCRNGGGNGVATILPEEGSYVEMEMVQIKGVDSTLRETNVELTKNAKLFVTERLMTDGKQQAESNIEVQLNGEDSSAQIISRSVGKGESVQTFHPNAIGNSKCQAHIQCDSIIMDHAEVGSIPEIRAKNVDAAIIHEAAIGRINDEQLLKLRTLGLTEEEAENVIIQNFLN